MVFLKKIYLDRYQSFRSRTFKFDEGVTAICGINGSMGSSMGWRPQRPKSKIFFENEGGETIELQRVRGTDDDEFVVDGIPAKL